jgi:hypothetical protein
MSEHCPYCYDPCKLNRTDLDPVFRRLLERLHEPNNEYGTIHLPAGALALEHLMPTIRQILAERGAST